MTLDFCKFKRTVITKGKNKGDKELMLTKYMIDGQSYDWYEIVDLREYVMST